MKTTRDISIIIPARNEEFLQRTIDDIFEHIEADTEVIAILDGYYVDLKPHERLVVIHNPESKGQRAATNQGARVAKGKYIIKTDAHCAFDQGFDRKMLEAYASLPDGDSVTMVPIMRNLHAFDWVCACGERRYQGPSGPCTKCGKETVKDIVWNPKPSPQSTTYMFDSSLHFQYWNDLDKRQKDKGPLIESMSLQGSFFMATLEKYWELGLSEEAFGSWGQQGVEVACKTWMSGGRVIVNKNTWYGHMFRTQGGDFGFPYELSGKAVQHARDYSKDLFMNNKWPKAIHNFKWLIDKFSPIPTWDVTKGVIYYTDNKVDPKIMSEVQQQIKNGALGMPIVSASLKPIEFGDNIVLNKERGHLTMFEQILAALEKLDTDVVFFCEHDVLYHPTHFNFIPAKKDKYYYNTNVWKLRINDGFCVKVDDMRQLSGLVCYRETAIKHYKERIRRVKEEGKFSVKMGFEPGTHNRAERVDDLKSEKFDSEFPNVDIRHDTNLTNNRWKKEEFRNQIYTQGWTECHVTEIPGWNDLDTLLIK